MVKTKNPEQELTDEVLALLDPTLPLTQDPSTANNVRPSKTDADESNSNLKGMREQLFILVSTGKSKEAVGVHLTHDKVKNLSDKEVEKLVRRYETYVGSKTTDSLISSGIFLVSKLVGMAVEIDDVEAYQRELKEDYIISHELANLAGNLAFTCGRFLALANAALITAKHANFSTPSADPGLAMTQGSEKFKAKHSPPIPEKVVNSDEQVVNSAEE